MKPKICEECKAEIKYSKRDPEYQHKDKPRNWYDEDNKRWVRLCKSCKDKKIKEEK